jgi:hypothetical protein
MPLEKKSGTAGLILIQSAVGFCNVGTEVWRVVKLFNLEV